MAKSVYFDALNGSDSNDGLSLLSAKETWAAAWALMDAGSSDTLWIVSPATLADGESWTVNKPGVDANNPFTIRGYCPDGVTRPTIVKLGSDPLFRLHSDPNDSDFTLIKDLILDGLNSGGQGISVYTTGGGIRFENLRIKRFLTHGISLSGGSGQNLDGVTAYRCIIHDIARTAGGPHTQGVYAEYSRNVTFDGGVVDHCGRLAADDSGTIYNHNFYISSTSGNITVSNTITARASATGIQHRRNEHHSTGNLVIDCPLGITFGHDDFLGSYPTLNVTGTCTGNAVLGAKDISPGEPRRGPGIGFGLAVGLTIDDNIVAHCADALSSAFRTDRPSTNVTVTNSRVYGWAAADFEFAGTSDPNEPTISVQDASNLPVGTIAEYLLEKGVDPGTDATATFMALAIENNNLAWDDRWTAQAVNAWLRAGDNDGDGLDPVAITVRDSLFHDRRPHVITIPFGANYGDNPQGLDPPWLTTPATRISETRATAARCGAPFIWLHMPAGSLASPNNYASSTDGVLPSGVLSYMLTFKPQVLQHSAGEQERWYIYHGRLMPTNMQQDSQVTSPDNRAGTTADDVSFTATAIDLFGRRGFWGNGVDFSSDNAQYAEDVRAATGWSQEVWGEAVPILTSPNRPDPDKITLMPYLALDSYIASIDPSNTFTFNKQTTKVVYFLDDAGRATTSYVDNIVSRGVIPGVVHGVTPEATQAYIRQYYTNRLPSVGTTAAF